MVQGRRSKNDSADVDNLFQHITPDWVSDLESEKRRESIFNKVWKAGWNPESKSPTHRHLARLLCARDLDNMFDYIDCSRVCLAHITGLLFLMFLGLAVQQMLALTWVMLLVHSGTLQPHCDTAHMIQTLLKFLCCIVWHARKLYRSQQPPCILLLLSADRHWRNVISCLLNPRCELADANKW